MSVEHFQRVERAFLAALAARQEGRALALHELCEGDDAVAAEVRSLLAHLPPDDDGGPSASREEGKAFLDPRELHGERRSTAAFGDVFREEGALLEEWGASAAGQRVGDFTLIAPIGAGGMGVVFLAEQERPRRTIALKLIRRTVATATLVKRFEREAQLLGRLNHPGIAQIYAAGVAELLSSRAVEDGALPIRVPYLAMEFVKGVSISKSVRDEPNAEKTQRSAADLIAQACDAVGHAHQRGVIHRDLKPANILVATDAAGEPQVKVLDFGVARDAAAEDDDQITQTPTLTVAGHIVGTLAYMSPEQLRGGDEMDTRCDVYALGVILFELLANRLPIDVRDKSLPEAARRIAEDESPRLGDLDRSLRGDMETIVAKSLEKDPARRYQTCADLARDLRHYLAGEPIEARRDSMAYVWRRRAAQYRTLAIAAALMLLMAAGIAVYAAIQQRREATITRRLADELFASHIEQGRLLGLSGDAAGAEHLLWDAHFERPASDVSRWALREFYARSGNALTLQAAPAEGRALAILPEGESFLAGCEKDGRLRAFAIDGGRILQTIDTPLKSVHVVVVAKDGKTAVVGGRGGACAIDLQSGAVRPLGEGDAEVWTLSMASAAGVKDEVVAIGGADGVGRLVRLSDGMTLAKTDVRIDGNGKPTVIRAVALDAEARQFALAHDDGVVRLWNLDISNDRITLTPGALVAGHTVPGLTSLAFSIDGAILASGGADRTLSLWKTADGAPVAATATDNGTCRSITASADGRYFAVSGFYGTRLFDARTGEHARLADVPLLGVAARGDFVARFTKDSQGLITLGGDGLSHVWNLSPIQTLSAAPALSPLKDIGIREIAVTRVGDVLRLVSTSLGGMVVAREVNVRDARRPDAWIVRWQQRIDNAALGANGYATCVSLSTDGTLVLVGRADGHVVALRGEDGALVGDISAHDGLVTAVRCVPGKPWIVTGGTDGRVRLWRHSPVGVWEKSNDLRCAGEVIGLAAMPDASRVVVTSKPSNVEWFSLSNGEPSVRFSDAAALWRPALSADGKRLAIGTWDRGVNVRKTTATTREYELAGHTQLVLQVAFDLKDGQRLASVSNDGTLRMWDTATDGADDRRRLLATFNPAAGDVISVATVPTEDEVAGSPLVVTGSADGLLRLWDWSRLDRFIEGQRSYQTSLRNAGK